MVAIFAQPERVVRSVCMLTLVCRLFAAFSVVTVATHSLGVESLIYMRALSNLFVFPNASCQEIQVVSHPTHGLLCDTICVAKSKVTVLMGGSLNFLRHLVVGKLSTRVHYSNFRVTMVLPDR